MVAGVRNSRMSAPPEKRQPTTVGTIVSVFLRVSVVNFFG